MALIEDAQGQQTGSLVICPRRSGADGLMEKVVSGGTMFNQTTDAPKGDAGYAKPSVHRLLEHPYCFA